MDEEYFDYCSNYEPLLHLIKSKGLSAFRFLNKTKETTSQGSVGTLKCINKYEPYVNQERVDDATTANAKDLILSIPGTYDKHYIIYKIGTETPYLCEHEFKVCQSLNKLAPYLPNFMRPMDLLRNINVDHYKPNPFKPDGTTTFDDVAFYEYIDSVTTLATLINSYNKILKNKGQKNHNVKHKIQMAAQKHIIDSLLNQTMVAVLVGQSKLNFVHNDLHFDNVLVSRCFERTFILYVFVKDEQTFTALIPTYGYYPTIIDYGFSFTNDLNNGPLFTGIHHNNKGYMNYTYDEFTDFKTILTRLVHYGYVKDKYYLNKLKSRLIHKLSIDRETGWDKNQSISISKYLNEYIKDMYRSIINTVYMDDIKGQTFLERYDYEVVDIIGTLIVLPLTQKPYDKLEQSLTTFINEWYKIERWLSSSKDKLYILKNIMDRIRSDVTTIEEEDKVTIINRFKDQLFTVMDKVSTKSLLRNLRYEDLYLSLIDLSECMEGIMYEQHNACMTRKAKEYSKLNITSSMDLYGLVEGYITHDYTFKLNDYIVVCDTINERSYSFVVQDVDLVNQANGLPLSERADFFLGHINPN